MRLARTCTSESKPRLAIPRNARAAAARAGHVTDVDGPLGPVRELRAAAATGFVTDPEAADEVVAAPARQRREQGAPLAHSARYPAGEPVAAERDGDPPLGGGPRGQLARRARCFG